jgi:ABC-type lipoprotein release transport system permease subunit
VFALFLSKAVVIGIVGGLLGYAAGMAAIYLWNRLGGDTASSVDLFQPAILLLVLLGAPLLGMLASFMPALWAAKQDPAVILQQE